MAVSTNIEGVPGKLELPLYTVDAFTDRPFTGNPAAVCPVTSSNGISDETMQQLATEMNISETAFITLLNQEDSFKTASTFGLRWFTPTNEVPLCGHATLASASVLFYCLDNQSELLTFQTQSGELTARRDEGQVVLDLPQAKQFENVKPEEIEKLLQCTIADLPIEDITLAVDRAKLLVRLQDTVTRKQLEELSPLVNLMKASHNTGSIKGVIVTVRGSADNGCVDKDGRVYDFVSRYFAPWNGIPEDPVTGSAHTVLGPYWAKILNKTEFYACQCSQRCGELRVTLRDHDRIDVAGKSTVIVRGTVQI